MSASGFEEYKSVHSERISGQRELQPASITMIVK